MLNFLKLLAHRTIGRASLQGVSALIAIALVAGPGPAARAADTITDLGVLPGGYASFPGGINTDGQVAGGADTASGTAFHAFVWDPVAGLQDVGTLGGNAYGNAINAGGTIAGHSTLALTGSLRFRDHAFRLIPGGGGMVDLGTLAGGSISRAYGINGPGQIVGESNGLVNGAVVFRAALWPTAGGAQSLGTLPGGGPSLAYAINDAGRVVGQADDASGVTRAFSWTEAGGLQDLGTLAGGTTAVARGINTTGQVAGWSTDATGAQRAVVWDPVTGVRDLGTLPGGTASVAYGINDAGTVVGISSLSDGSYRAVVWSPAGAIRSLGTLSGGAFSVAYGINAANQVVGQSTNSEGNDHAVRWQLDRPPVAEDAALTTPQDTAVAVGLSGSDPDGDAVTFAIVAAPSNGTLSGTPPALTYTPAAGFTGTDTFTFKLTAVGVDSNVATVSVAVTAVDPPVTVPPADNATGRMKGQGLVDAGIQRAVFDFQLASSAGPSGGYGQLAFRRWTRGSQGDEREALGSGRPVDRFVTTVVSAVAFTDDPSLGPSKRAASGLVDSATFSGEGRWNGAPGYTFEATATDAGEPGVGRDQFSVTIRAPSGELVATAAGTLIGGNIQSTRPAAAAVVGAAATGKKPK